MFKRLPIHFRLILKLLLVVGLVIVIEQLEFSTAEAATGINDQISFQGKVVNSDGTNVTDGSYTFVFTIYDAASGGTNLWTESKSVTVTDGIFQTNLGDTTDLPGSVDFNTDNIYLGVEFNSDGEMTPRIRFTAVPQAFNAEKVAGLTVTNTTGTLTIPDSTTIEFSGANNLTVTTSGATNVTLPTTGTLATLAGTETLTNKSIGATGLTFDGAATDITTGTDEDLTIDANGTGQLVISDNTDLNGTLSVSGDITFDASTPTVVINDAETFTITDGSNTLFSIADNGSFGTLEMSGEISTGTLTIGNESFSSLTGDGLELNGTSLQLASSTAGSGLSYSGGVLSVSNLDSTGIADDTLNFNDFSDSLIIDANTTIDFYNGSNTNLQFYNSNLAEQMLYMEGSSGNIGIGTNSPNTKLQVKGDGTAGLEYVLTLQNPDDTTGAATGLLFNTSSTDTGGKGALVFERDNTNGRGEFNFLIDNTADGGNPEITEAQVRIDDEGLVVNSDSTSDLFPTLLGFSDLSGGEYARFQFGDQYNAIQNQFGGSMDIYSYHTLRLSGNRNGTASSWSTETDIGVHVIGTTATDPTLVISGASSQSNNLTEWRDFSGTVMTRIDENGNLFLTNEVSTGTLTVSGEATVGTLVAQGTVTLENGETIDNSTDDTIVFNTDAANGAGVVRLPVKTTTGDPALDVEGNMYYNTFDNKFRCYQDTGWTDCIGSGGSQTPWTSDIDASGYDLTSISNVGFQETTGAPAGTSVAIYRDNSGDMNLNALSTKAVNIQVAGTDEYTLSATTFDAKDNTIQTTGSVLGASIDRQDAGELAIGNTNATSVSLCNSAGCDTISIGTNTDADTITIGDSNDGLTIASTDFNVASGAVSGVTTLASSGDWTWTATTPTITLNSGEGLSITDGSGTYTFDTDSGPTYTGAARPTRQVTLSPEYPGATLVADGSSNTGTMISDFCENGFSTDVPDTNTGVCNTSTDIHNYYQWSTTQGSAQDYDIYVRWRVPDNFAAWDSNPIDIYGKRTDATNNAITVYVYDTTGTLENSGGTQVSGTAWTSTTVEASFAGTYTAGEYMTIRIVMTADTNDSVEVGEINLDYLSSN